MTDAKAVRFPIFTVTAVRHTRGFETTPTKGSFHEDQTIRGVGDYRRGGGGFPRPESARAKRCGPKAGDTTGRHLGRESARHAGTVELCPDPHGTFRATASVHGAFSVRIPGFLYGLPAQYESEEFPTFWGEVMLTGRNEAEGTVIWWGLKSSVPSETYLFEKQLVVIAVDSFTVSLTAPGKTQVTHRIKVYDPSADADGDGLPDLGQGPVFTAAPFISQDTGLTLGALGF